MQESLFDFQEQETLFPRSDAEGQLAVTLGGLVKALWLALTRSPSSASQPEVGRRELATLLDGMVWCLDGSISREEFHMLWEAWCSRRAGGASKKDKKDKKSKKKGEDNACDASTLLGLVRERWCSTEEVTLMIGLVSFEDGRHMVLRSSRAFGLSTRWLSLVNALFFSLDVWGKGSIGFDELLFFVVAVGRSCVETPVPAEAVSPTIWFASALRLAEDMGARFVDEELREVGEGCWVPNPSPWELKVEGRGCVSLTMFRGYLQKTRVSEDCLLGMVRAVETHRSFVEERLSERRREGMSEGEREMKALVGLACERGRSERRGNSRFVGVPRCWWGAVGRELLEASFPLPPDFGEFLVEEEGEVLSCSHFLGFEATEKSAVWLWKAYARRKRGSGLGEGLEVTERELSSDVLFKTILSALDAVVSMREEVVGWLEELDVRRIEALSEFPFPDGSAMLLKAGELSEEVVGTLSGDVLAQEKMSREVLSRRALEDVEAEVSRAREKARREARRLAKESNAFMDRARLKMNHFNHEEFGLDLIESLGGHKREEKEGGGDEEGDWEKVFTLHELDEKGERVEESVEEVSEERMEAYAKELQGLIRSMGRGGSNRGSTNSREELDLDVLRDVLTLGSFILNQSGK